MLVSAFPNSENSAQVYVNQWFVNCLNFFLFEYNGTRVFNGPMQQNKGILTCNGVQSFEIMFII